MFRDRFDAGQQLAKRLNQYANQEDVLVLGMPRGGVPVAFEAAKALNAPLDLLLVRKLGAPEQPELAIGAIATGGVRVLDHGLISALGVSEEQLKAIIAAQEAELRRRELLYRGDRPGISVRGQIAILIDDGIATGSNMLAAVAALRSLQPSEIVVATPVTSTDAHNRIELECDEFICLVEEEHFLGIGQFYANFRQTKDWEVRDLLRRAQAVTMKRPQLVDTSAA